MVKKFLKCVFWIPLLCGVFTIFSCHVDLLGLFGSTDLAKRLRERDNFVFLTDEDRTPSSGFGDEYSFIVLADTHIDGGDAYGLEKLKDKIYEINNDGDSANDVKFVVIAGDLTQYGTAQDINTFINIAGAFGVPCYPVIGNHDVYFGNWPEWKKLIGSTCYRIDGGDTTLFILDSANSWFGKDQLDWLEKELKNVSGKVFVFTHTNFFVESPLELQHITDIKERSRFISILRNKCDIMFMGHSHKRVISEAGNVRYVNIEDFKGTKVYCLVTVTNSGVSYKFEKLE